MWNEQMWLQSNPLQLRIRFLQPIVHWKMCRQLNNRRQSDNLCKIIVYMHLVCSSFYGTSFIYFNVYFEILFTCLSILVYDKWFCSCWVPKCYGFCCRFCVFDRSNSYSLEKCLDPKKTAFDVDYSSQNCFKKCVLLFARTHSITSKHLF